MLISYSAIFFLCTAALCIQARLVSENNRFDKKTKHTFYLTYLFVMLSGIGEWGGVFLNHAPNSLRWLHAAMKLLDYTATPMAGICFAMQVSRAERPYRTAGAVMAFNILLQLASLYTGWTFYIDADNVYQRGPLYWIYVVIYIYSALFGYMEFIRHGKHFKKQNETSLSMILAMMCVSILMQMFMVQVKTIYIGMTLCSVMLFVHFNEFSQMAMEDELDMRKRMLEIDAMTEIYSRHAYIEALESYEKDGLPEGLAVFMTDINGLKTINDEFGHSAGDEVIRAVAQCLDATFKDCGRCYRTGGDEFVCFAHLDRDGAAAATEHIKRTLGEWHGILSDKANASVGCVISDDHPEQDAQGLVALADRRMYEDKKEYYRSIGEKERT